VSIFTKAFNRLGGYDSLAERFPGGPEPPGQRWEDRCVQFGRSMRYDWCVTVIVAAGGLWLQARPPLQGTQLAIFVPWNGIRAAEPTMLYWRKAVRLTCGEPAAGVITVWQPVWDVAGPLWQGAQDAWPQAPPPAPPAT
jgi:hypothetical protein